MAKKVTAVVKLQLPAGKATPGHIQCVYYTYSTDLSSD